MAKKQYRKPAPGSKTKFKVGAKRGVPKPGKKNEYK